MLRAGAALFASLAHGPVNAGTDQYSTSTMDRVMTTPPCVIVPGMQTLRILECVIGCQLRMVLFGEAAITLQHLAGIKHRHLRFGDWPRGASKVRTHDNRSSAFCCVLSWATSKCHDGIWMMKHLEAALTRRVSSRGVRTDLMKHRMKSTPLLSDGIYLSYRALAVGT